MAEFSGRIVREIPVGVRMTDEMLFLFLRGLGREEVTDQELAAIIQPLFIHWLEGALWLNRRLKEEA